MIKPTLFIGLGTTGVSILKTLRQLMSEEFGRGGLPIFRYVAIETTEVESGDNLNSFEEYEKISVVNATIPDLIQIRNRLNPNHPNYNPDIADWLNPEVLKINHGFRDKIANIRMVGRLCLWENWAEIKRTLHNAFNTAISANTQRTTMEILRQHYESKNLPVLPEMIDPSGINVYVFGSLCGGTCSGMMIDIAYSIRHLLGDGYENNIYGIFTMYDRWMAESHDMVNSVRAANCYASLSELNYYNHLNTTYDVTFPSGIKVKDPRKPFDYELLVSPSGKLPHIRFVAGGRVDEYGLNLMVALNLFLEAAGDTGGYKAALRTDWQGFEGYGQLKPVPVGEIPTMTRCLTSFGLTVIWYPKYRIASAAACCVSAELCKKLKGRHTSDERIKADASNEWNCILENVDILTSPQFEDQPSLTDEIGSLLDSANETFKGVSSVQLMEKMNAFPGGKRETFGSMFDVDGKYFDSMKSKLDECKRVFLSSLDQLLDNQLAKVDFDDTYGFGDVRAFFVELDRSIEQTIHQCPPRPPTLDLNELNFEPMRLAEKNIWLKITGRQKRMVTVHQDRLIEKYRQLIIGKEGIYQNLRDYFLRAILEDVRAKLGFEGGSDGPTIHKQLMQIEGNLDNCIQELQVDYEYEVHPPTYSHVKIITNNLQNSIRADAEVLCNQIINDIPSELFESGNVVTMSAFLKKEQQDIKSQMIETLRRSVLHRINQDNLLITTKVQEILDADDGEIMNLAERSNPYQEFSPMYQPFHIDNFGGQQIILGHDPSETNDGLKDLQEKLGFGRSGYSAVDHFLFFYQEESGFAFDDLASYEVLKRHLENSPGAYGHWIHQDPDFFDIIFAEKRGKLKRWCCALAQLVPEIQQNNENAFKDVFQYLDETLFFEYVDDGLVQRLCLTDDAPGIERFCRQYNETHYNNFFKSVIDEFNRLEADNVIQQANHLVGQVTDREKREVLSDSFNEFLDEVYHM